MRNYNNNNNNLWLIDFFLYNSIYSKYLESKRKRIRKRVRVRVKKLQQLGS